MHLFARLLFLVIFGKGDALALEVFPVFFEQLILIVLLQFRTSGELFKNVVEDTFFDLSVLQHVLNGYLVFVLRSYIFGQDSEHI